MSEEVTQKVVKSEVLQPDAATVLESPAKKFSFPKKNYKNLLVQFVLVILVVGTGIATGWKLSSSASSKTATSDSPLVQVNQSGANEVGLQGSGGDCAQGMLLEGGIKGEGTFHLDRDLGESKFVYLTSTAVDLGGMVGKKVEVCGQTIKARFAGWLIDVTRMKTL